MHRNAIELIPREILFKKGLLEALVDFRTLGNSNRENANEKEAILEELKNKIGDLPQMNAEDINKFFAIIFTEIIQKLDEFYEIEVKTIENDKYLSNNYELKRKEPIKNVIADFQKYSKSTRFMEGFLNERSTSIYHLASNLRYSVNSFGETVREDVLSITPYTVRKNMDEFVRDMRRSKIHGVYGSMLSHRSYMNKLVGKHEEFMRYVNMYVEESKEIVRKEYVQFGAKYLKEVLSRIIVPVSLLEDEVLQKACEEQGREVFVFKPEISDLLYNGAQVHVYSKHDLEDELGYKIAPLRLDAILPTDTEEYKYHGIGTYTRHDIESKRSMKGQIPHVIGDVLYCGADMDEFMAIIPEELLEEIRICEEISASIGNEERSEIKESSAITHLVKQLKEQVQEEVADIVNGFMNLSIPSGNESDWIDIDLLNNASVEEIYGKDLARHLLTQNERHPYGYAILQDVDGHYYAVSTPNGEKVVKEITNSEGESGIQEAFNRCCRELNLTAGLYTVYKFEKRSGLKNEAILSLKHFGGME